MKRILAIAMSAAVMLFAASCGPKDPEVDKASLTADPTELTFGAVAAQSQTITVKATGGVEWDYVVPEIAKEWVAVDRDGGSLIVSVSDNQKGASRSTILTLKATNNSDVKERSVGVTQEANDNPVEFSLTLKPAFLNFEGSETTAQEVTVTVTGDMTWEAVPSASWIKVTPGEGKFTVEVEDNPDGKQREGEIVVTPSDSEVKAESVRVVQAGRKIFEITNTEGKTFPAVIIGETPLQMDIEAKNVKWDYSIEYPEGGPEGWINPTVTDNALIIRVVTNPEMTERSATVIITTDWDKIDEIRVPVKQEAASDHLSTLTEPVDLTGKITRVQVDLTPWQIGDGEIDEETGEYVEYSNRTKLFVHLYNETFTTFVSGEGYVGTGYELRLVFLVDRIEWNKESIFYIPTEKPYTVRDVPNSQNIYVERYTIAEGKAQQTSANKYVNSYLLEYDNCECLNKAPIKEGTITVTHNGETGDNYTFVVDLEDDFGMAITGEWTGDVEWNLTGWMVE